jgi:hypothetical protein
MTNAVRICKCKLPVPHRHPNGEHYCDACGGFIGNAGESGRASEHPVEGCGCPPCARGKCTAPKTQS